MNDRIGQQLGNYRLVALLGRGSYAEVYLGQHVRLHLQAAIKLLHTHLTDKEAEHFQQEAQTIATLAHPSIVRVFDFDVQDDVPFLVMDYAPNGSLRQRYPKGSVVPLPQILSSVKQVVAALQYAHEQKVIHRDVKPENMLLGRYQEVLLSDFGIATIAHNTSSQSPEALAGTVPYMAPEQLERHPRPASDQYALAVVVYEWLCGQCPFEGSVTQVLFQHVSMPPPALRERVPTIPAAVDQVVLRALAKDPKSRFARVQDFALALEGACSAPRVFDAPSRGEATVAADPAGLSLLRSQVSAQLSPADEPQVDPALAIERNASLPTTPAGPVHVRPLWKVPTSLTSFVGREQDVATISALLMRPGVRLLTLTGPGGVGKTRLGLQVAAKLADRFADGVHFVPLAMVREPSLVVPALAQALHLQQSRGLPLLEQVQGALHDKHALLLLDNFEHVAQTAPLLEDLLLACPSLTILVTSRDVLHLRAERQFPVAPFPLPKLSQGADIEELAQNPAVALFLERAQAIVPTFQLTSANARAITDICIALDGLPLALELAAARIKALPPQALLTRLKERLDLLTGGQRTLPERQQTLRKTLQWSYHLLSRQEQWLFRLCSVFIGGCTLHALEAVAATLSKTRASLLDLVTALLDKSLLVLVEQEGEEGEGEPRFVMLETVREYGLEALRECGERETSYQAHVTYYLRLAEEAETHFKGGGQQLVWLKRLTREQANLRAALAWLLERRDAQTLLRLSGALWWYWNLRGSSSEALEWLERALELPGAQEPTVARARALCGAGFLTVYLHSPRREGLALLEQSLATASQLGEQMTMAETCAYYAQAHIYLKDYRAARALAERGIALSHAVGERNCVALNQSVLALVVEKEGEEAEAAAQWERSLQLARELDEDVAIGTRARRHLAALALAHGDYARATTLLGENLALSREAGNQTALCWALAGLAELARLQGDLVRAQALCAEGLALSRDTGDRYATSRLLCIQGKIAQAQGEHERAVISYRDGLQLSATMDASAIAGQCLLGLAQEALAAGGFSQATRLFAAATHRLTMNKQLAPTERAAYERDLADLRAHLDATTFTTAWAEGEVMTPQQALASSYVFHHEDLSSPISGKARTFRYPDQLSAREVEVLRLVAQGWTDAQIAEELIISTRTVNAHLTSIYRKIRVSSRHAAAHYALTQHLV